MTVLDKNSFKKISENPIILDFSLCKTLEDIHFILKEKFGLPEYYGKNLDAIWDLLCDIFSEGKNYVVEIYGYNKLERNLRDYCSGLLSVFNDISTEYSSVVFKVI
ncbi:MAG: barstar family protein [Clostridia bacterium]|nr:barstar family protein [Clostridia bacterium]